MCKCPHFEGDSQKMTYGSTVSSTPFSLPSSIPFLSDHIPHEHFNIVNRKLCREDYKVLSYCLLKGSNSGRLPVVLCTDGRVLNVTYQLCGLERFLSHTFATIRLQDSVDQGYKDSKFSLFLATRESQIKTLKCDKIYK